MHTAGLIPSAGDRGCARQPLGSRRYGRGYYPPRKTLDVASHICGRGIAGLDAANTYIRIARRPLNVGRALTTA